MQKQWATVSKEIGLDKPIVQRSATLGNRCRRIVAPKGAGSSPVGHPLHRRTGRFRRTRRTLIAVLKPFLQVLVACRRSLRCDPADDGYERHADPMPLEIECERHTRPCAVVERFDGDARARPDRSSDTVSGPAPGVIDLRYLLGHRPLSATDPAGCGEP